MYRTTGVVIKYVTSFLYGGAPVKATWKIFLGWRGGVAVSAGGISQPGSLQMILEL